MVTIRLVTPIHRPRLTRDFLPPATPPSRCKLGSEHPVQHALRDADDVIGTQWRADLHQYQATLVTLAAMAPGDPAAETMLRAAAGFVSKAHSALASQRCSCRIASWVFQDTTKIYEHAQRLLGTQAASSFEPTWIPL